MTDKTGKIKDANQNEIIDGELVDDLINLPFGKSLKNDAGNLENSKQEKSSSRKIKIANPKSQTQNPKSLVRNQKIFLLIPFIFLTVALLGGMRIAEPHNDFLFLKPALVCLVFAAILIVLFFRAKLINISGWFSENFTGIENIAGACVLAALFAASVQVFNSLLPERGLPFWIIGFCFFWTLWNNLFADFDVKKLIRSLGAMFGLAFVVKYLVLANLAAPQEEGWWQGILQNPTQTAFTWVLDLPRFAAATGYIQFFTLIFYLAGLFLLPSDAHQKSESSVVSSERIS